MCPVVLVGQLDFDMSPGHIFSQGVLATTTSLGGRTMESVVGTRGRNEPRLPLHSVAVPTLSGAGLRSELLRLRSELVLFPLSVSATPTSPFPGGTRGKEPICQRRRYKRWGFKPWVGKIPWRRARWPTPVCLPGEPHRQKSLAGYHPWGCKGSDTTERLSTAPQHRCACPWEGPWQLLNVWWCGGCGCLCTELRTASDALPVRRERLPHVWVSFIPHGQHLPSAPVSGASKCSGAPPKWTLPIVFPLVPSALQPSKGAHLSILDLRAGAPNM